MKEIQFEIYDSKIPAQGLYEPKSLLKGNAKITIDMSKILEKYGTNYKDKLLEICTHEFCHVMQEYLDKPFCEYEVNKVLTKIKPEWDFMKNDSHYNYSVYLDEIFNILKNLKYSVKWYQKFGLTFVTKQFEKIYGGILLHQEGRKKYNLEKIKSNI